ncbi:MAG TPA: GTP-binding protein, partial [Clostridiaceae bacterium]
MSDLIKEIERRRTFAIISHPDAGKTTLTEKFLLYGGAIRLAGSVKARKSSKHAVSDWMEIEKQRGISVTSSVMQFNYDGFCINILDTPGHQDFSEDTYRTLMAADSAVMVVDAAKGVEEQTKKLFHVCRMRGIPVFTFINKMDRESRDPFELMEDIENVLNIKSYPMNWPIGSGSDFRGVFDRQKSLIEVFSGGKHGQTEVESVEGKVDETVFQELLGNSLHSKLMEDIELLDIAGDEFDIKKVRSGELTP